MQFPKVTCVTEKLAEGRGKFFLEGRVSGVPKWGGRGEGRKSPGRGKGDCRGSEMDWAWHICMYVRGTARMPGGGEEWERRGRGCRLGCWGCRWRCGRGWGTKVCRALGFSLACPGALSGQVIGGLPPGLSEAQILLSDETAPHPGGLETSEILSPNTTLQIRCGHCFGKSLNQPVISFPRVVMTCPLPHPG